MSKFRKKPVVIEAVKFDGSTRSIQEILGNLDEGRGGVFVAVPGEEPEKIVIPTLEGEMTASLGDWVIKGVQGELYPCKPDIFEATYEPVP